MVLDVMIDRLMGFQCYSGARTIPFRRKCTLTFEPDFIPGLVVACSAMLPCDAGRRPSAAACQPCRHWGKGPILQGSV